MSWVCHCRAISSEWMPQESRASICQWERWVTIAASLSLSTSRNACLQGTADFSAKFLGSFTS